MPLVSLDVFGAVHIVDEVRLAHKGMLVIDWLLGVSNPWIRLNKVKVKSKFVRICISFAQRGGAVLRFLKHSRGKSKQEDFTLVDLQVLLMLFKDSTYIPAKKL